MPTIVKTMTPIDSISGMLGKRENSVNKKAFIVNVRRAMTSTRFDGQPFMYLSLKQNDRKSAPTITELETRAAFTAVQAAVRARLRNPDKIAQDQAAFHDQRETGFPTIWSYIWNLEWAAYLENN